MCFEWKNRFACGHIGFTKVERCARLGAGCFGPDGSEQFLEVAALCYDCETRILEPPAEPAEMIPGGGQGGSPTGTETEGDTPDSFDGARGK